MTITLQALSLVEKAEPIQVHFTLRLRDWRSMWIQNGCKVYMGSYMTSYGSCCMVTWTISKYHLLEIGLTQKMRDHSTMNARNHWFILCYHVWRPAWIQIFWNNIWLGPNHIWLHTTWFRRCLGMAFGHFLLGSHNFMVTALGSCVKWPKAWLKNPCNIELMI